MKKKINTLIAIEILKNNNNYINPLKKIINKKQNIGLIHKTYVSCLKSLRIYTANTKTKSEVKGGGRKPWKQKGTGRARAGSTRSPLWRGGGVCFGPKPKNVFLKINRKEKQKAISASLWLKKNTIRIMSEFWFKRCFIKTAQLSNKLKIFFEFYKKKYILISSNLPSSCFLSAKNLKNVKLCGKDNLALPDVLKASLIIFVI